MIAMRGRKKNHTACVYCRQMKLACDRYKNRSSSCSRCRKVGRQCFIDPSFKRENKSERLANLERELHQAKHDVGARGHSPQRSHDEDWHVFQNASTADGGTDSSFRAGWKIGDIYLPDDLVETLLNEYYAYYDPFCPTLPGRSSFLSYTRASPLLLHTVMTIASRRMHAYREIHIALVEAVSTKLSQSIWPKKDSIMLMQALLLLCHWPLPFGKNEDPCHAIIAQATHIGLRLQLHQPGHVDESHNDHCKDKDEECIWRRTWVVCFIMNVSISAQLGLPATVHLDQGLVELISSRPPWLPFTLFSQLQIARHALSIGTIPASGSLSTLGSFFEIELRIVEEQSTAFWSPTDRIIFLGTKLMLYICTREATSSWWLINGYLTATSIVQVAASGDFPWAYAPLRIHKIVLNAVCLLLLLKCTRYRHPISTDTFALNNLICRGRELLSQLPTSSGDFISRVLMVVDLLSDVSGRPRSENDLEKLLVIKTRMGANIALSAAKFAREESMRMQEGIGNQTLLNPSELAGMEDLDMLLDMDWGLE